MRIRLIVATLVLGVGLCGLALAVPPGKILTFNESPMGKVVFDGQVHKDAGIQCMECHNDGMFPKMAQGTVKITMEAIYAGRLCGVCHNGQRAFATVGNCSRCHLRE
jgi:c(7)-type cytochrome triheme protein